MEVTLDLGVALLEFVLQSDRNKYSVTISFSTTKRLLLLHSTAISHLFQYISNPLIGVYLFVSII